MSNLSKGTGSRKDTKMRIRAFPVSLDWAPGTPGPGARPRVAREARAELPPTGRRPGLPSPHAAGRGARAFPATGLRGAPALAPPPSRPVPRAQRPVRRRAPTRSGASCRPAGVGWGRGPFAGPSTSPHYWGVGPAASTPLPARLLGPTDPRGWRLSKSSLLWGLCLTFHVWLHKNNPVQMTAFRADL